ncbi:Uncharacterized protein involved in formate dehydrogenase formation-like protein [Desulforamulus reducens MI-1]|uniref:Uncharacterized protein involved in formate dehydrogenase formation-like protein n=1 Tax=Desulforamulus reducens (strain ATCC BAA-1160 / DSM 100696 / MI-1) TaxID=349161 RepID=A4J3J9_DESRM|nr:formate dehydrogenase accessory protein FdhE [Desulforamulus reducens]ABO49652.1 Uncharacterized protein involved in formate dehydrogenase formation-like protein [Desulforamulus reducens MI-1]
METKKNAEKLANFYLDIMEQENEFEALEWKIDLDSEQVIRWYQGEAALSLAAPDIPEEIVFNRFINVARACQKWQVGPLPVTNEFINNLERLNDSKRKEFINALFKVAGNKAWIKGLNVSPEFLDFIAQITFKPILNAYGEAVLDKVELDKWSHSHCPVCGDQPIMAKFSGKEGYRILHCGRCETEWRYKRLGCPYCKEENASQATFITMEDFKQYRVYLCERCKSYLKTVDERLAGEVDLFCEDLATVELDRLAQAEGYQRGHRRQQT